ncbi:MAG TPA: DNA integrity scanning diadenylate cyclase DisA [Candidatus Nanoarchaeia archaeon]|nr:DNA integrity scanning diadenylate cyclase DisA [Candidatus Nanoarchaeia archaeon]
MAKEIQKHILEESKEKFVTEDEFFSVLRTVAPGTNFRTALNGALRIGKGALIVVENKNVSKIFEGGFEINATFTPQKLMELSKMDGAIILSSDLKSISYANVLLTPDSNLKTSETGTRHKAAERTAKQAGTLAIAISERRHQITLFYKNIRYTLIDTGELLRRANEHMQLLEKQRDLFDKNVEKLTGSELKKNFGLKQAINVIQKGYLIQKISEDLKKYSIELGSEATLIKIRLKEITSGVERETDLVIKDYTNFNLKRSKSFLDEYTCDDVLLQENVCKALDFDNPNVQASIKGWRVLSKTTLQDAEIAKLAEESGDFGKILEASERFFEKIFDDKEKAKNLKSQLEKMKATYS